MTDRLDQLASGPGFGRSLVHHDERSKAYRAVESLDKTTPRSWTWRRGPAYDQGQTEHCVAYTGKGVLNTTPMAAGVPYHVRTAYDVLAFYNGAQSLDDWPGSAYPGTSGLGLCRYLAKVGLVREYRWAFGMAECLLALSWIGPVGLGCTWREGMRTPDAYGYVRAAGAEMGGHEVELTAIDVTAKTVTITNSWGAGWGVHGRALLTFDDLASLLDRRGDAFVVVA